MVASHVAEEIVDYLPHLTSEQQEAVLHVVKAFAEVPVKAGPDDAELLRRLADLKSGKVKGYTLEEVRQRLRQKRSS